MNHLSLRRISRCVIGDVSAEEAAHARACVVCGAEVARLESSLAVFRDSVRHWSHQVGGTARASAFEFEETWQPVGEEIWGLYGRQKKSWGLALGFHAAAVALLLLAAPHDAVHQAVRRAIELYAPVEIASNAPKAIPEQGGGGGGDRSPLPASKGRLPKAALKQFTPPAAVVQNLQPRLAIDPSIIAPPDMPLPQVAMSSYGDPLARLGPPSNGPGSGGGIGSGIGGGVGSGSGPGAGPGKAGGIGGGIFRIGGSVSAPVLLVKVEPEYSEEARKTKYQGTVVLSVVVDADGHVADLRVVHSLGLGLDEKAIEAVKKWKFRPGYKNGKPVAVMAQIEVNFRLL